MAELLKLRDVRAFGYRVPLKTPVVTSFGRMNDRPAVFIRAEDVDGVVGWGEAWCNFPSVGAEHRVRIVNEILAPMACEGGPASASQIFERLSQRTSVLALQSGEVGPFAQAIAGIDLALWDLTGRRKEQPLWKMLGGDNPTIEVYASGINPTGSLAQAEDALRRGHRALKLKIGFAPDLDRDNLRSLRGLLGPEGTFAADVNQAWSLEAAIGRAGEIDSFDLKWIEEPIRADRPWDEWRRLHAAFKTPLAAGENFAGRETFAHALEDDTLAVVQPDVAKWGGISACLPIARDVRAAGKTYCPHYLGGGIGLLASAHLLAAVGGDGLLEIDSNDNPLREAFCGAVAQVRQGQVTLDHAPGLGITPDLPSIEAWRSA